MNLRTLLTTGLVTLFAFLAISLSVATAVLAASPACTGASAQGQAHRSSQATFNVCVKNTPGN